jgi:hypothetical protein
MPSPSQTLNQRLPLTARWYKGATRPPLGTEEIVFWEDTAEDNAKILMKRSNRVFIFESFEAGSAGFVTDGRTLTAGAGLTGGGTLAADRTFDVGAGTGITVNANDVTVNQAFSPTWTGTHTFNTNRATFNAGLSLGTSGSAQSAVVDGASAVAFDQDDTVARTQGFARKLRNSSGGQLLEAVSYDGRFAFGYSTTLAPEVGTVLSFLSSDTASPTGAPIYKGIYGQALHADTGETVTTMVGGIVGSGGLSTATGWSTATAVYGLKGVGYCSADSASFSAKHIAGVWAYPGRGSPQTDGVGLDTADTTVIVAGDWAHATGFWARCMMPGGTMSLPTNRPAIASSYYAPIQAWSSTSGEQWAIYGDNPTHGTNAITPAIGGFARIPFAARGTRRTALYFVPHAAASGGPTGNAAGDVYFDDGTNEPYGLWEHDGTAWRYLLNQQDYTADVTSTAATLGGIGAGPAAAAQAGWVKIRVDDGTAAGGTVWVPFWV